MAVLSPGDRAQMWGDTLRADPESRASRVQGLAMTVFQAVGSALGLYSDDYAQASVASLELLDGCRLLEQNALRHAFEQIDEEEGSAQALAFILATQLREVAAAQRVEDAERQRALELADLWWDAAEETSRPGEVEGVPVLTVAEVAARFEVTPQAVYKWVEKGAVEAIRTPGNSIRIPADQFERAKQFDRKRAARLRAELAAKGFEPPSDKELVEEIRQRRGASQ